MISRVHYIAVLLLLLAAPDLTAQARRMAENWHFSSGASVTFRNGFPELDGPSSIDPFEGVVSLSDTNGNLLFYTNGGGRLPASGQSTGIIWNQEGGVLYDMRGEEGGGASARQSSIAFPDPSGEAGLYYLFTMEEAEFDIGGAVDGQPRGRGLSYFLIDMNLNGGLGGVRTADERVYVPTYEGLDATPMADGTGYWVICNDDSAGGANSANAVVVPVTAAGVGTPDVQDIGNPGGSSFCFSPDGRFLYNGRRILAFDNVTGTVGAVLAETDGLVNISATFTPDSRYLYAIRGSAALGQVLTRISTDDFMREDVARIAGADATEVVLPISTIQIGPDYNLYFVEELFRAAAGESEVGLTQVSCPSGTAPQVARRLVDLTDAVAGARDFLPTHLPQFVDAIFALEAAPDTTFLPPLTATKCPGEVLAISARPAGGPSSNYVWDDGIFGPDRTISEAGTYCVTYDGPCGPTVDCQTYRDLDLRLDLVLTDVETEGCVGVAVIDIQSGRDSFDNLLIEAFTRTSPPVSVFRSTLDNGEGLRLTVREAGLLVTATAQATTPGGICTVLTDLVIDPITVSTPDDYAIRVVGDAELCSGQEVTLVLDNFSDFEVDSLAWLGDPALDGDSVSLILEAGVEYFADVTDECGDVFTIPLNATVAEFCDCAYSIPEIISPNSDGTNDVFRLFANCPVTDYTLVVFNRWGQKVFSSSDPDLVWDGTVAGRPANSDSYLYRLAFRLPGEADLLREEGQFALVR